MKLETSFSIKGSRLDSFWQRNREDLIAVGLTLSAITILYAILFVISFIG